MASSSLPMAHPPDAPPPAGLPALPGATTAAAAPDPRSGLAGLTLAALGVVYGDIGTSPLYTLKEVFAPATGVSLTPANLVGVVSAIFWALMAVVTLKYVLLVLRADNRGEGGVLALAALAMASARRVGARHALLLLGAAGAALFYGDSILTPAISVLGAVEGLSVLTPTLTPWVLPLSLAVLVGLFALQRLGTAAVGRCFGPVIVVWFVTLALTGAWQIAQQPAILAALNPLQAWAFLSGRGWGVLAAVGAIVLALTGAEALYADLGHFGRRPIQRAWCGLVLPALALNYLGQGALLMREPAALDNPFFRLFPTALLVPAVLLATLAAIIASQAVISGAYSLTHQAMQLGLLPRLTVRHTSAAAAGQIYLPAVNAALLLGVLGVVLGFGSASALAGAYGIAVTLTMAITTVLAGPVLRRRWQLPLALGLAATGAFLAVDLLLVAGCALKLPDGGWFALAVAGGLWGLMHTWQQGRARLLQLQQHAGLPLLPFIASLATPPGDAAGGVARAQRNAVYPVADAEQVPQALLHNLKHNQVLHACNVLATVVVEPRPTVPEAERLVLQALGQGFWRAQVHVGFMQPPDLPGALALAAAQGLPLPPMETSYLLSHETLVPPTGLRHWRQQLFALINQRAGSAAHHFKLPDNAVVELGARIRL